MSFKKLSITYFSFVVASYISLFGFPVLSSISMRRKTKKRDIEEFLYSKRYQQVINEINALTNIDNLDQIVSSIVFLLSDEGIKPAKRCGQILLITSYLKNKAYQVSDDVLKITFCVEQIYEHILYEKMKF